MAAEIAPFTREDIAEVFELWRGSEGIGLFGDTPEVIASCLERSPGLSFIARDGGELVGAVLCTHDGRRGYLHHLAVARSHHRLGIGSRLADRCLAALKALGIARCHLFVRNGNDSALAFWSSTGWRTRDDVVMMSRTLSDQG